MAIWWPGGERFSSILYFWKQFFSIFRPGLEPRFPKILLEKFQTFSFQDFSFSARRCLQTGNNHLSGKLPDSGCSSGKIRPDFAACPKIPEQMSSLASIFSGLYFLVEFPVRGIFPVPAVPENFCKPSWRHRRRSPQSRSKALRMKHRARLELVLVNLKTSHQN